MADIVRHRTAQPEPLYLSSLDRLFQLGSCVSYILACDPCTSSPAAAVLQCYASLNVRYLQNQHWRYLSLVTSNFCYTSTQHRQHIHETDTDIAKLNQTHPDSFPWKAKQT